MTRAVHEVDGLPESDLRECDVPAPFGDAAPGPRVERQQCERCGAPARVCVLEGYVGSHPVHRHFCLDCADSAYRLYLENSPGRVRPRLSWASLFISAGLLLTALGAAADEFGVHGSAGFGWKQQGSLLVGALVVVIGALLRVELLAIAGAVLVGLAALADVFGPVGSPGVGWKQAATIFTGLAFLSAGLLTRKRRSPQRSPRTG